MRVQPQPMVDVLIVDVAQKIFISGDAERGRAAAPFDLKSAVGLNFGKIANRPGVSDNVAVTHNATPATAGGKENQAGAKSDRKLIHNSTVTGEMRGSSRLDSRIFEIGAISRSEILLSARVRHSGKIRCGNFPVPSLLPVWKE